MKQRLFAHARRNFADVGCSANLYELFWKRPDSVWQHLSRLADGSAHERHAELDRWNQAAREFGVNAGLHVRAGKPLVEVVDSGGAATCIIYQVDGVWQTDDFDGTSRRTTGLTAALQAVVNV